MCQNPEISIVKASVSDTGNCIVFEVDDTIDYTFTVTNEGDVDITNILDVGEVWMYEASHIIMQADIDNGSVLNTADVNGNTALGDVDHTSNTVTVLICTSSSIALIRV